MTSYLSVKASNQILHHDHTTDRSGIIKKQTSESESNGNQHEPLPVQKQLKLHVQSLLDRSIQNQSYRKVLDTGSKLQFVSMHLKPYQEIPWEAHQTAEQWILVLEGAVKITSPNDHAERLLSYEVFETESILIPCGQQHHVQAHGQGAKLLTIYSYPQHSPFLEQRERPKTTQPQQDPEHKSSSSSSTS